MGLQPTASKTALLLACPRPFAATTEISREKVGEAARYGRALHKVLELEGECDIPAITLKYGVVGCDDELKAHGIRTLRLLRDWMGGNNPFNEKFAIAGKETHRRLIFPLAHLGRGEECAFDEEGHHYDLGGDWAIGGTDDLTLESAGGMRVVVDYKSGDWGDFHFPAAIPQMLTLAIMTDAKAVAILHSPRDGVPVMYCDELEESALYNHAKELERALSLVDSGMLRPGSHCNRCPAKDSCPARDGELLGRADALIRLGSKHLTTEDVVVDKGKMHLLLSELERLSKRAREILKAEVAAGEVIVRPDGKTLTIRRLVREGISKASIVRGLGREEGEKEILRLKSLGCLTVSESESLVAE